MPVQTEHRFPFDLSEVTVPGRAERGEQGADHTFAAGSQQGTQILVEGGRPGCGLAVLAHVVTIPILTT